MKKEVKKMINFLKEAEGILAGEAFEDLGKKQKLAIFDAFIDAEIPYEIDGDEDRCYLIAEIADFRLIFASHARYFAKEEIRETLDDMRLGTDEKWDDASIPEATRYLESMISKI